MKHILTIFLILNALLMLILVMPSPAQAQVNTPKQEYHKAKVIAVEKEGRKEVGKQKNIYQIVKVRLLEGPEKNRELPLEYGGMFTITDSQKLQTGETVILGKSTDQGNSTSYRIVDRYRISTILFIIAGFFLLIFAVAGRRGVGSVLGMLTSLGIIVLFIVPQILAGRDPLIISITGSLIIMIITMLLTHGIRRQTFIALAATCVSLLLTAFLAGVFVNFSRLSGLGTEDAYSLQQLFQNTINFQGLLLGGIIIGSLGVLDDVTTTQAATIEELADANPKASVETLARKGMNIGRTHIASVVNTLVLAYAGASIGIFIFLVLGVRNDIQPLWVILNSEVITEEIIRTIAGTAGLILAVPITTLLAAFFAKHEIKIM